MATQNEKVNVSSNQSETIVTVTCQHGQPVEFTLAQE